MRALPHGKARPRARTARRPTPREIYQHLDLHVVGQERAKRVVAVAAYNHLKRCSLPPQKKRELRKSNVLLVGPTGSGKSTMMNVLTGIYVPTAGGISFAGQSVVGRTSSDRCALPPHATLKPST